MFKHIFSCFIFTAARVVNKTAMIMEANPFKHMEKNKTKQNKTKQKNKTKQNKTKRNKTKQNKTKQNNNKTTTTKKSGLNSNGIPLKHISFRLLFSQPLELWIKLRWLWMSLHLSTRFKYTIFRISLKLLLTMPFRSSMSLEITRKFSRCFLAFSYSLTHIPIVQNLGKINLVFFVLKCVSGWQVIFQETLVFPVETFPAHIKTAHRLTKRQNNTEESSLGESLLKTIHTANKQTNKQTNNQPNKQKTELKIFDMPRYEGKKVFCSEKNCFFVSCLFSKKQFTATDLLLSILPFRSAKCAPL